MDNDLQGLQFDRAEPALTSDQTDTAAGVACVACRGAISEEYFDLNGKTVCATCRTEIERHAVTPRDWGTLVRAALLGFGAALVGAALYFAVVAITNFEIGLVAIAIGYIVGLAVRYGARGHGGKRFQVLALVLAYWSVGAAYVPLAIRDAQRSESAAQTPATAGTAAIDARENDAAAPSVSRLLFTLFVLSFVFPVLVVWGSLPSGLITAVIIGVGMRQAWLMTAAPTIQVTGPYRIASPSTVSV